MILGLNSLRLQKLFFLQGISNLYHLLNNFKEFRLIHLLFSFQDILLLFHLQNRMTNLKSTSKGVLFLLLESCIRIKPSWFSYQIIPLISYNLLIFCYSEKRCISRLMISHKLLMMKMKSSSQYQFLYS